MPLSFIDWVSLIANIVTILGIGGFLLTYISNRRKDKKIANETLANAIKLASVRLNLYRVKSKKNLSSSRLSNNSKKRAQKLERKYNFIRNRHRLAI